MKYANLILIILLSTKSYSAVKCANLFIKSANTGSQSNAYTESAILSTLDGLVELKFQIDSGNVQDTQIKQAHEKLRRDLGKIIKIDRKYLQIFNEKMKARFTELYEKDNSHRREEREKERQKEDAVREAMTSISRSRKLVFNKILPGTFPMLGAQKPVTITKAFELAQTQTTQLQWSTVQILIAKYINKNLDQLSEDQINPSLFKHREESRIIPIEGKNIQMQPYHPVLHVSYDDVALWITGLNELSQTNNDLIQKELQKIIPGHKLGHIYDLPTEAQWAFVKQNRGKNNEAYFDKSDASEVEQYAWYDENSIGEPHAVATKLPRKIDRGDGILVYFYDLEGNISEWIKDSWDGISQLQGGIDPLGIAGPFRVKRGNSLSSGTRRSGRPGFAYINDGFRLSRTGPF